MTIEKLGIQKVVPILEMRDETPTKSRMPVKSITVQIPEIASKAKPGQFVMMWLYGIDEKPMGVASCNLKSDVLTFAVAKIGSTTEAIHKLEKNDLIGIRGPFGKGFSLKGTDIAIIGGGTGIAPTRFQTEVALEKGISVTLFHGARSKDELAFRAYFESLEKKNKLFSYKPSTDDGSYGFKGFSTECFNKELNNNHKFDYVYSCGPELMMHAAFQLTEKYDLPFEASLADRYFKCAIGLCGQCTVDPIGLRLCIDGPVLTSAQLREVTDFGKYGRDKFGRKTSI